MTDLDQTVERLNRLEGVIAYVRRPAGVSILMGLFVLAGILHVLLGIAALTRAGFDTSLFELFPGLAGLFPFGNVSEGFLTAMWATSGVVLLVLGILDLVVAWALWDLKSWAWGFAMTLSIIELFVVPFGTILGILRIVYLSLHDVRDAYREGTVFRAHVRSARRAY